MDKDKHFYIIVALLLVIVVLLVMVFMEQKKTAANLVGEASDRLQDCQDALSRWKQQHPAGANVDEPARNELSTILSNCSSAINQ